MTSVPDWATLATSDVEGVRSGRGAAVMRWMAMTGAVLWCVTGMAAAVTPPPANVPFDYQLGGAYVPAPDVAVLVRDRTASPLPGRYNICYVNAFQTQPGESGWWKTHHPGLLVRNNGRLLVDPGWPDELLFDTSTAARREGLIAIVGAWIDQCAADGFDAVEPDNLDSWLRSQQRLTQADNIAFARLLVERAHAAGLAIAQKNASELAVQGAHDIGFDFAVVEECEVWAECEAYIAAYGQRVYAIEYSDSDRDAQGRRVDPSTFFESSCAARGDRIPVIYRDRGLGTPEDGGYVYRRC